MKALVTGCSGFVGQALCRMLKASDWQVFGMDIRPSEFPITMFPTDIRQPVSGRVLPREVDVCFHLAAIPDPAGSFRYSVEHWNVNLCGTAHILSACAEAQVKHFIYVSTSAIYGDGPMPAKEDQAPRPRSPYAATKSLGEMLALMSGIPCASIRPTRLLGPGYHHGIVRSLVDASKKQERFQLVADGTGTCAYLHVDDLCRAMILLAEKKQVGVFNCGHTDAISIEEIVSKTDALAGGQSRLGDKELAHPGDQKDVALDVSKLLALGWEPKIPIRKALKETVKWLMK